MRMFFFLLLIIIFTSCDHPKKPYIEELTWPKRTVKLDNNLGVLTIRLPEEFDTFYKWNDISDCHCCGAKKYRFSAASFPLNMESGQYNDKKVDSVYYFTIIHSEGKNCLNIGELDTFIMNQRVSYFEEKKQELKIGVESIWIIKEVKIINNSKFIILANNFIVEDILKDSSKNSDQATVIADTYFNNDVISLRFYCAAHNCDSFISKMYKSLKTVEIKSQ
jgi:hypothetical protein